MLHCICEQISSGRTSASTLQIYCTMSVGFACLMVWRMQNLDHLVGSNQRASLSLVDGSRCWWLCILKAWVPFEVKRKAALVLLDIAIRTVQTYLFRVYG